MHTLDGQVLAKMLLLCGSGFPSRRRSLMLALGLWVLGWLSLACGQELTFTFSTPTERVTAGAAVSVWLNALNASSNSATWTFPPTIESRLVAVPSTFAVALTLRAADFAPVAIAPGAFARREYVLPMPKMVNGQVVVEFSQLNANRLLFAVESPLIAASATTETNTGKASRFNRLMTEVEPVVPGEDFDPGRFFKEHVSGYEPMYFVVGTKSPNAKFQISFQYQLLNSAGRLAQTVPALKGFHFAYTQTSLWDWNAPSAPFYDSSYKPELFYAWEHVIGGQRTNWFDLDLQGGLKHESNGKDGADSRSLNIAYLRPTLVLGRPTGLQLTLQPRVWAYLGGVDGNPDMDEYRGYADLRAVIGWQRGLQLSALGRMGKSGDHGGLQLDLTYPTMRFFGSFSLYLDVQYFTGYGESLLGYNQKSEQFRVGFSLYR